MSKGETVKKLRNLKFRVATRLLEHIGSGLYSKYTKAISELVVNGYDADANYVTVDIHITSQPPRGQKGFDELLQIGGESRIVIQDNGEGMDEGDIRDAYLFLGSGQKRTRKRTPVYHRLPIGNKGIGKLAGFGIAKRIEIVTIKNERQLEFCLDRDELDQAEKLGKLGESILDRASFPLTEKTVKGQPNQTTVILKKIRPECGTIDIPKLMGYLAHELPISQDFKIMVNGKQCTPKNIPASRKIRVNHTDPVCGLINGEIIIAKSMLKQPGVFTTVRGRIVGEPSLFGLSPTSFTYHVGDLISGSIEVESFDPADADEEMPVIKTDREGFIESHPKYQAYYSYMYELLTEICKEEEKRHQEKADAEKRARVDEAIHKVAQDLNAYDGLIKRQARQDSITKGHENEDGRKATRPNLTIETKNRLGRHRDHEPIPPKIMREIDAILGSGRVHFRQQSFTIKQHPLGVDYYECDVLPNESVILVNIDHPTYEQGIREKCIEIVVFRAIAAKLAFIGNESPDTIYEELDQMLRFQAARMKRRENKDSTTQGSEYLTTV